MLDGWDQLPSASISDTSPAKPPPKKKVAPKKPAAPKATKPKIAPKYDFILFQLRLQPNIKISGLSRVSPFLTWMMRTWSVNVSREYYTYISPTHMHVQLITRGPLRRLLPRIQIALNQRLCLYPMLCP